jgi:kumamolisin
MHRIDRSYLATPAGLVATGDVDPETKMRITVVLRPQARMDIMAPRLSRAEFRARHATSQEVVDRIAAYARNSRLAVEAADGANHVVRLTGSFAAAEAAFRPDHVQRFMLDGAEYLCRSGRLWVPDDLAEHVVAVMGFDQRPVARPHFRIRPRTAASTVSYDPAAVAERYRFPSGVSGRGQTIALIELGGGFDASQVAKYFEEKNIKRTGSLAAVSVGGASTSPTGDSSGADGEVQLDIEVAGSVAPGANIIVYFGSNAGEGFFNTLSTAVHDNQHSPTVVSISWGGPESSWSGQDIDAMDQVFKLQQASALRSAWHPAIKGRRTAARMARRPRTSRLPVHTLLVVGEPIYRAPARKWRGMTEQREVPVEADTAAASLGPLGKLATIKLAGVYLTCQRMPTRPPDIMLWWTDRIRWSAVPALQPPFGLP